MHTTVMTVMTAAKLLTKAKYHACYDAPTDARVAPAGAQEGDIVAFSSYRHTDSFFVTKEIGLLRAPDSSGAGYISIPLEFSMLFANAVEAYSDCSGDVSYIELAHDDEWLTEQVPGKSLRDGISYTLYFGTGRITSSDGAVVRGDQGRSPEMESWAQDIEARLEAMYAAAEAASGSGSA